MNISSRGSLFLFKPDSLRKQIERERINQSYVKGEITLDKYKEYIEKYRKKSPNNGKA